MPRLSSPTRARTPALPVLAVLLAGCGGGLLPPPGDPRPPSFEFRLGPGDRLAITAWGEEALEDLERTVGPDGRVSLPLVGEVELDGRTLDEARVEIAQRLEAMLEDPVVSIALLETRSHVIHVLGEVARPGSVPYVHGASVLGVLQAAGGFLPGTAALEEVRVVRDRLGEHRAYAVDIEAVLAGEARDMWLVPGDVVYVAPRLLTRWDRWWRQASPWGEPIEGPPRR